MWWSCRPGSRAPPPASSTEAPGRGVMAGPTSTITPSRTRTSTAAAPAHLARPGRAARSRSERPEHGRGVRAERGARPLDRAGPGGAASTPAGTATVGPVARPPPRTWRRRAPTGHLDRASSVGPCGRQAGQRIGDRVGAEARAGTVPDHEAARHGGVVAEGHPPAPVGPPVAGDRHPHLGPPPRPAARRRCPAVRAPVVARPR